VKFYSLINPESEKELPLLRFSTTVIGSPPNGDNLKLDWESFSNENVDNKIAYRVADWIGGNQPILLKSIENVISILENPCLEIEDSCEDNPCFDEVPEEWMKLLVPVKIEITDTSLNKESVKILLYEINEDHRLFSKEMNPELTYIDYKKGGNKFIQYVDEIPDPKDSNIYWNDSVRKFILSNVLSDFPIIIEHEDFGVFGGRNELLDDTFKKVKKYLTITKLKKPIYE
jgi:hypothetical protein